MSWDYSRRGRSHSPACRDSSESGLAHYFDGTAIYGDDFTPSQIADWFNREKEGYADLGAKREREYRYVYHELNRIHGYRLLARNRRFHHVLGFGSAYGDELLPIVDRVEHITIVDPSDSFMRTELSGKPVERVRPDPSGTLPFADGTFDLITCFGVLHHIPNVSYVLSEFQRVLAPGGIVLVREPIVSMGDWRKPRQGLTANERGLPLTPFLHAINSARLTTRTFHLTGFGPINWLIRKGRYGRAYNSATLTRIDWFLAESARWNYGYHAYRNTVREKLRPTSVFAILERSQESPEIHT